MKVIAEGGITSKNIPPNSRDSVMLTMSSSLASGFSSNIFYTKDKNMVVLNNDQVNILTNGKNSLEDHLSNDILKHNIGNKVVTREPILLEDLLNMYEEQGCNKIILLRIDGTLLENSEFIKQLMNLINNYPLIEIFILSDNIKQLRRLSELKTKARFGVSVCKNTMSNLDEILDFYSLDLDIVIHDIADGIFKANRALFINRINSCDELDKLKDILSEQQLHCSYVITDNFGQFISNM